MLSQQENLIIIVRVRRILISLLTCLLISRLSVYFSEPDAFEIGENVALMLILCDKLKICEILPLGMHEL